LIDYQVTGAVARITLNRPGKRNALSEPMMAGIADALSSAARNEAVRVVLIAGVGQDFCSGMDIALLEKTADAGVMQHLDLAGTLAGLYRAMRRHPQPVIAAVTGRALGGGCGLATACDVVLAAESAQFGYPEVKIGFVPAIVMSMLRRSVGEKRAFELLVSGEAISARDALEIGLITRVYPDAQFETRVEAYIAGLVEKPASAVYLTKKLLYQIDAMGFDAAIEAGVQVNALSRMSDDARRGFEQFLKRNE
jgi:methylglutaconyl-CoA hydratase